MIAQSVDSGISARKEAQTLMVIRLALHLIALGVSVLLSILNGPQLWKDLRNGDAGDTIVSREF
jgi:hypothetical protein